MPSTYVIDASVFISRVRPSEPDHVTARLLLNRVAQESWQVYVPSILLAEVAAAISRTSGRLSLARRQLTLIQQMTHIEVVSVEKSLANLAANIALQERIRGCDAIYVALAQARNAILISLDQEQLERAPSTVVTRTPAQELALLPPINRSN